MALDKKKKKFPTPDLNEQIPCHCSEDIGAHALDRFLDIFGKIRNNSEPPGKQNKRSGTWSEEDTEGRY